MRIFFITPLLLWSGVCFGQTNSLVNYQTKELISSQDVLEKRLQAIDLYKSIYYGKAPDKSRFFSDISSYFKSGEGPTFNPQLSAVPEECHHFFVTLSSLRKDA